MGLYETKAHQAEGITMRFLLSIRTLFFALFMLGISAASFAQIGVSISFAPPALPVYEQPICPGDGYIWTPGYWAYDDSSDDYYWVPGTWVMAPEVGFLWTPAYWGWGGAGFLFHEGYWGPHVGFYGGINYGFGYFGQGYEGGRWDNGHFFYNRSVNNVNINDIHNVYNTNINHGEVSRVSYNGGNGGITARATAEEDAAAHERHVAPAAVQTQHQQAARTNTQQRASVNMGKPPIAATSRPGEFNDRAAVPAREAGAPYTPANRAGNSAARSENTSARTSTPVHPRDLPPVARPAAPNTGNANLDKKYQQQQDQQFAKQQQERDKLQQKQDQEHVKLAKQNVSQGQNQQVEQKHQQQTQQLAQKHTQQQQKLQAKQQPQRQSSAKPQGGKS
jgi:hypothetical protein